MRKKLTEQEAATPADPTQLPPWDPSRRSLKKVPTKNGPKTYDVPAYIHRLKTRFAWRVELGKERPLFTDNQYDGPLDALRHAEAWLKKHWKPEEAPPKNGTNRHELLIKPWHHSQSREITIESTGQEVMVPRGIVPIQGQFPSWQARPLGGQSKAFGAKKHGGVRKALWVAIAYLKPTYREWQWRVAAGVLGLDLKDVPGRAEARILLKAAKVTDHLHVRFELTDADVERLEELRLARRPPDAVEPIATPSMDSWMRVHLCLDQTAPPRP